MKRSVCVVDTNVVVSGLIGSSTGPPARMLRAMLEGGTLYLMSSDLLAEYSAVLRRPKIARLHGRTNDEVNHLLADLIANAIWREPVDEDAAPDAGDNHLRGAAWRPSAGSARHGRPASRRERSGRSPCSFSSSVR